MNASLFVEFVSKWFKAIVGKVTEKINADSGKYLFKTMLRKEVSPDLRWDSTVVSRSVVAADVVAMDSELPLKKRDALSTASGTIPKIGMKMFKSEKLISDINIMRARGQKEADIVAKIFDDVARVIGGVFERLEFMFLRGLSTGVMLVQDSENVGVGVRVDFGYLAENQFGVKANWNDISSSLPITDIDAVLDKAKADGCTITTIALDKASFNRLRSSKQAKELYGARLGIAGSSLIPSPSVFTDIFKDEYGINLLVVDRTVYHEKDGKRVPVKPFAENTLVFLSDDIVGSLVYGEVPEATSPVSGVEYQNSDFILVSKYSKNDPLREFTSSQAMALPVIENVNSIYLLKTDNVTG